jgi:4-amino-4-deoxy-L-arabinose transferase-like glycosyltransferase
MNKTLEILKTRQTGNILAILIVVAFVIISLIRLYPFENSFRIILAGIDDWSRYAQYATDIKHNDLSMPMVHGNYIMPAGFLYCYFLALCFSLFGENNIPVYIIQSFLLGLSVALIYWTFRDRMRPLTSMAFLFTVTLFALLDVSKNYSFRMLSENLTIFTLSCFFYCFMKGFKKNKLSWQLAAAVLMGLSILTRPNIFPFGIILTVIVMYYYLKQGKKGLLPLLLFILFLVMSTSFLAFRNHFVTGDWVFLPVEGSSFAKGFFSQDTFSLSLILKKVLFCLGGLTPLEPGYQWRPHWILLWAGYFVYLFLRLKDIRKTELWEVTLHLFIFSYYLLLILITPKLGSYGFRLLLPAIFIVLPFPFMAFDILNEHRTNRQK